MWLESNFEYLNTITANNNKQIKENTGIEISRKLQNKNKTNYRKKVLDVFEALGNKQVNVLIDEIQRID